VPEGDVVGSQCVNGLLQAAPPNPGLCYLRLLVRRVVEHVTYTALDRQRAPRTEATTSVESSASVRSPRLFLYEDRSESLAM